MEYLIQKYIDFIQNKVKAVIVLQFYATLILAWVPVYYWRDFYPIISNCVGYSILTNSVLLLFIWSKPYSFGLLYRAMVVSLIISNVFSCIALVISYDFYTSIFDKYFTAAFTVLLYLYFKKNQKKYISQ